MTLSSDHATPLGDPAPPDNRAPTDHHAPSDHHAPVDHPAPISLVIVEDEPLMRELLSISLTATGLFAIAGTYGSAEEAFQQVDPHGIDAAVVDVTLGPGASGLDLAGWWRGMRPDIALCVLTSRRDAAMLLAFAQLGTAGSSYLHKRSAMSVGELSSAITSAVAGRFRLDEALTSELPPTPAAIAPLTPGQERVLTLVGRGLSNSAIALELSLSVRTVENTISAAFRALGLNTDDSSTNPRVMAGLAYFRYLSRQEPATA